MNTRTRNHLRPPMRAFLISSALAVSLGVGYASESEARGSRLRTAISSAPVVQHAKSVLPEELSVRELFNDGPIISVGKSLVDEHRSGFSDFGGRDCLPGSRCQQFSDDLVDFLDDVLDLVAIVPGDAVDAERIEKLRDRLDNGEMRPFVLYLMSRALPENGRWRALPSTIYSIVEDIEKIGEDESDVGGPGWRCGELRRGARPERLKLRKALINQLKARLHMVNPTVDFIKAAGKAVPNIRGGVAAAVNATIGVSPGEILVLLSTETVKTLIGNIDATLNLRKATLEVRIARIDLACADK